MATVRGIHGEVKRLQEARGYLILQFMSLISHFCQLIGSRRAPHAVDQLLRLRTAEDEQTVLLLPAELDRECQKTGSTAAVCGSNYDVWQGVWLGTIPVALKLCREFRVGVRDERAMTVSDRALGELRIV